jgi:hypothetical protein
MMTLRARCAALVIIGALAPLAAPFAQTPAAPADPSAAFAKTEVMIPMRDGVKLHTIIYAPKNATGNLPVLLTRTPYGIAGAGGSFATSYAELAEEGFIFVFQDVRGRGMSEGEFVNMRPHNPKKGPKDADESSDAWDTVEWLVKNGPDNNGKAGMVGTSYPGFYAAAATIDSHPALRACTTRATTRGMPRARARGLPP